MRGYDIIGPWIAKLVGKNDFNKSMAMLLSDKFIREYENKPLTLKQKIISKYGVANLRYLVRFLGWLISKFE